VGDGPGTITHVGILDMACSRKENERRMADCS
jgi:hypothetical protein